jgi:hypothetical protein
MKKQEMDKFDGERHGGMEAGKQGSWAFHVIRILMIRHRQHF